VKENAAVLVLEPNAHTEKNDSLQKKEICPNGGDTSLQDQVNQLGTHDTAFDNANFTEDCHNVQPEVIKLQAEICKLKEQVDLLEEEVKTVIRAYENYRKRVRALGHEY
jgi:FtsZ-binding cell division protein ZapB